MSRRLRLLPLLLVLVLLGCSADRRSVADRERQARLQRLLQACRQQQQRLPSLLDAFAAAESRLADIRNRSYVASAPPTPLNPDEQRRLTIYDQQVEQDLHEQAVDAWRRSEAEQRERWERDQQGQQQEALDALLSAALPLRQLHGDLLVPGSPPRLNGPEVERFRQCKPEQFR